MPPRSRRVGPLPVGARAGPRSADRQLETLPKAQPDSLDGDAVRHLPDLGRGRFVRTGEVKGGSRHEEPVDIASTTKLMTASARPELGSGSIRRSSMSRSRSRSGLMEPSARPAAVRAGESASVREILYGLLLPSGNDASVALAEHFGTALRRSEESEKDPLDLFVARMNRRGRTA